MWWEIARFLQFEFFLGISTPTLDSSETSKKSNDMKHFTFITLVLISFFAVNAQQYKQSLAGIEWVKIESKSSITVKTHTTNELLIKSENTTKIPERAKGLKLIGEGGADNTEMGFYVVKEGNNLIVRNLRKSNHSTAEIYLPASQNISVTTRGTGAADIEIIGFKSEIEASALLNGSIHIENVSGPVTADSLNGGITISFSTLNQDSPITIYATNGELDITLPKNTPANLSLGTVNGDIYTDFDLKFPEKNGLKSISFSQKLNQAINGGGVPFQLKTTNGNIYLRKK